MGAYEVFFYHATFHFGFPRPDSTAYVVPSGSLTEPSPDSTGYTFGGWYADALYATLFDFTNALTQDTAVYAKWTLNNYTVDFERESGLIYETQPVNHGNLATEPSAPDSIGYTFGGWYADTVRTTPFDFAGSITRDSTLHAKWTLIPPPTLEVCGLPLPPVEGAGTTVNPFTAGVTLPIYTEKLTPEDIYTGDDADIITFYTDPGCTQPVRAVDLYQGETVTVYIAVKVGNMTFYYAIDVTRLSEFTPLIRRNVTLPLIDGVVTDPPAGLHQVISGRDFVFTLTSTGVGLYSNTSPLVRTGRDNLSDDVLITPTTAAGTYTVRIRAVRSDITLSIDLMTANTDVATAKVRSYGHTLYISATGDGTARIYGLTGQLIKALPHTASETAQTTLPRGVYIVVVNGRTYKVIIE
ncbi:MAG: InlB B-repeat-containing protein [Tannerella sp.]|jgi:uncharacterized repeat protein (TIGR02543 family)|nr:InlB B-repeat-containing protein [Tannerella sp.]